MIQNRIVKTDDLYHNDIIFAVALRCKFKQSIAIISSCKDLWVLRSEFYRRKHLLWYSKPILNFWTPEQHFYASGCKFALLIDTGTLYMDIDGLFQHNNTVDIIKDRYDYAPIFTIDDRFLVIWNIYSKSKTNVSWSFTFHTTPTDIKDKLQSMIELEDTMSLEYAIIDLHITVPCWTIFNNIEPKIDHVYEWVSLDRLGKIISGE